MQREKSSQSLNKFIGWRTRRDPWPMFAGQASVSQAFMENQSEFLSSVLLRGCA